MTAPSPALDSSLQRARQRFLESLAGRLTRVFDSVERWRREAPAAAGDGELLQARRELHTLCGTAGTLGFAIIARSASLLRETLGHAWEEHSAPTPSQVDSGLARLVDAAIDAQLAPALPPVNARSAHATTRIVVIDDDPHLLAGTSLHLQGAGAEVVAFTDAARALAVLDDIGADAVVTDWQMPHTDGAEVVRDIRQRAYAADLPVVVYSSAMTPDAAAQLQALGADACVSKLSPPHELVATVTRLLAPRAADARALPDL